ncbi:hypothetical protein [Comamonas koreensis]|uniref:Uncharacterized protein n=1 Tax=Comamonas koreensis TaxID=160825 RepID=A0AAW4XV59_9BURK|nr:hypothetical protein [Comamonas koreensis]MCD2165533.1 hypothetical protein [Comamonas koreensis]
MFSALNIFLSWAFVPLLALFELKSLKKIDENKLKYFLLNGASFPFFSVGVVAGFFYYSDNYMEQKAQQVQEFA